ncbi:MAG: hypothetical protein ABIJ18_03595 [archaeon]
MKNKLATTLVLLTSIISLSQQPKIPNLPEARQESTFEINRDRIDISHWTFLNDEPITAIVFKYENRDLNLLYGNVIRAKSFNPDYIFVANRLHQIYFDRNNTDDSFLVQLQPNYVYYDLK